MSARTRKYEHRKWIIKRIVFYLVFILLYVAAILFVKPDIFFDSKVLVAIILGLVIFSGFFFYFLLKKRKEILIS